MPLIKCPECCASISDRAPTCPHCGLPNPACQPPSVPDESPPPLPPRNASAIHSQKPSEKFPFFTVGLVAFLVICFVLPISYAVFRATYDDAPVDPAIEYYHSDPKPLDIDVVHYQYSHIVIKNNNSFPLKKVKLEINYRVLGSGYCFYPDDIPAGESISIPLREFTSKDNVYLDPTHIKVTKLYITCDPPYKYEDMHCTYWK